MKKTLAMVVLTAAFCATASAQGTSIPKEVKETFYGTKASKSPNNPCKGATTRVCGIRVITYSDMGDNTTRVTRLTTDCDGDVLENWTNIIPFPIDSIAKSPGAGKSFDIRHRGNNDDNDNTGGTPRP